MRKIIITSMFIFSAFAAFSQTVKADGNGNFNEVEPTPKTAEQLTANCKQTGTLKTKEGETLPVYLSKNGKPFVIRNSKKTGNPYRSYLKIEGQ